MIVGHRGACRHAPENTIPSFELAWEVGADAIEGDFRLTSDGKIVCMHDPHTGRVADRKLIVADSTLEELRGLNAGAGATIPTIAEVFATIPDGKKIYIEIKCSEEIIPALLEEIGRSGLEKSQVVVISFSADVIRAFKSAAPEFKTFWLCGSPASLKAVLDTLEEANADGLSSGSRSIDESIIRGVLDAGHEYHVWTIDDLETAKKFRRLGAMSISTNDPGHLKKNVDEWPR